MIYNKTFPSGLRLVGETIENAYGVSFGVMVDVGSVREETCENGYSHFIEHMQFKGTEKRSSRDISEEMEDIGADLNAYTSKDCTCYYTRTAANDLDKGVEMLSDMYFNATFPDDELQREKKVVLEEISMNNDSPEDVSQDIIAEAVYKDQKIGQTILGLVENINNCDRHSILNFKKKHYTPYTTVVSVAGKFDWQQVCQLVEQYFESNFNGEYCKADDEEYSKYSTCSLVVNKPVDQAHISLAVGTGCGLGDIDQCAKLYLASAVLGGGLSSRLFQKIREERGLAYSVYSFLSEYKNSGYIEIYCGTNPDSVPECVDLLRDTIADFVDNGITDKELKRAKAHVVTTLGFASESSISRMRSNARQLIKLGRVLTIDETLAPYTKVTVDDVQEVSQKLFTGKMASSYVGKKGKQSDCLKEFSVK